MLYDVAVIGAGINGCCIAYRLHQAGQKVAMFDSSGIASGGSGAAGAFLSPKFSKSGELKELINTVLDLALDFYTQNFSQHIQHHPLVHIAQDEKDAEILQAFKADTDIELLENPQFTPNNEYVYTSKSAIVDAQQMCKALVEGIDFYQEEITNLQQSSQGWLLNDHYKAKKIILATGAYEHTLIQLPYKMVRGVWGHRIDIHTATNNQLSLHQFVSISPTSDAKLSIGATHNVHYHPQHSQEPYSYEEGREELLEKASRTLELQDVKVVKDYVGLRSGSIDYIPMVGKVVDHERSFNSLEIKEMTRKNPDSSKLTYIKDLYVINGSAGYGFVLAPYLSKILCDHIVETKEIPKRLSPARFFYRWVKKEKLN